MSGTHKEIAIIGGGVSGLYLGWRLSGILPREEYGITIYEKEVVDGSGQPRLGGRIRTCDIRLKEGDGKAVQLGAELGAMRFPDRHLIVSSLIRHLGFDQGIFNLDSLFYIRGKLLCEDQFEKGDIPYGLREEEKGRTPSELLQYAIARALDQISVHPADPLFILRLREKILTHQTIEPKDWVRLAKEGVFDSIKLHDIGFWNLIKHFLSTEAFLLCQDGFGFLSVISNWNAAEAFKWLIADFAPDQCFLNVGGGFSQLIGKLGEKVRSKAQGRLVRVTWRPEEKKFSLQFAEGFEASADYLVLAIPPRSLQEVKIEGVHDPDWLRLVRSSRPHRLEKIVLIYRKPWWKDTNLPGGESGRIFTDLPMRQIYYLGPQWLAKSGFSSSADYSAILIYNDSLYEGFWRTFSVYKHVYVKGDRSQDWLRRVLGPLPSEISAPGMEVAAQGEDLVRVRMEEKIRFQLRELHKVEVPMALAGVYKDWADEGGWHTWEPFVDVGSAKKVMAQPFREAGPGLVVCDPEEKDRIPFYVCGEAYAWEQGWVEGALMSAEALVAELAEAMPFEYHIPEWLLAEMDSSGRQSRWRNYMYPELEACLHGDSLTRGL